MRGLIDRALNSDRVMHPARLAPETAERGTSRNALDSARDVHDVYG
ncbi:hypothetical protein GSH05_07500 [Burkholderia pseudomallei]|uniref:Uncharacterized protein n=4 Tax=pseudomallei group TaxID=111527 RepID=A0AAX1XE19_BURML|nr:hypothetical protein BMAA0312 [Burkholderia mallei ATCC 23344]AUG24988.1 hypothetical protein CXQ84_32395 [Burkholderia pseudomallei]EET05314.1 conserved hypothetical protein [Burkholderia pseudomallei 1710a]EMP73667.1 hypothetical protein D512_27238 [Burkholderia pseudomallei MSHR1043]PNX05305.1 hypothetical protein CF649_04540 [Burkholderia sp. 136(2017)]PNX18133.1 hypothetical protein CF650_01950 [Burkholderia sp. 129]PNX32209.1 hypothetical protein CF647_04445 [Burkholderia sp. 117]PN